MRRKRLLLPLGIFGVVVCCCLGVALAGPLFCLYDSSSDVPSPDGRYRARIVSQNCGATTPYVSELHLFAEGELAIHLGPRLWFGGTSVVARYPSHWRDIRLSWTDGHHLRVETLECVTAQRIAAYGWRDASWRDISLSYQDQC
jgi:hypothetical protein